MESKKRPRSPNSLRQDSGASKQDKNKKATTWTCISIGESQVLRKEALWFVSKTAGSFVGHDPVYGLLKVEQLCVPEDIHVLNVLFKPDATATSMNQNAVGIPLLTQVHLLGKKALLFVPLDSDEEMNLLDLATVRLGEDDGFMMGQEYVLVSNELPSISKPKEAKTARGWLLYAIPRGAASEFEDGLLKNAQLALVFGIEHTLLRSYDLVHLQPPRETELAMLQEFDASEQVTLPGGKRVMPVEEETLFDDLTSNEDEVIRKLFAQREKEDGKTPAKADEKHLRLLRKHPVLRLNSPEGELILTKLALDGEARDVRSLLIHIRPGCTELRKYIANKKKGEDGGKNLFRVFALFKQARARREALEYWKFLDPEGWLVPKEDLMTRIYSDLVKPTRSFEAAMKCFLWELPLACGIDNSTRWESDIPKIWPIRPFDPYVGGKDFALASVSHGIHNVRNMFFEKCDLTTTQLKSWLAGDLMLPQPSTPELMKIIQIQKHTWLQEFQTPTAQNVSQELATAKDYADPILRNRWHLVVDTNVLHHCISDDFEFFKTLEHTHGETIVLVIPFAVIQELDWQKHNSGNEKKKLDASAAIRFLNRLATAGSRFVVMQSMAEDAPFEAKHRNINSYNSQNDMRVFECANSRHQAGLKTVVLSGDINLRNVALSANVPAVRFQDLWRMLSDAKFQRLTPSQWIYVLQAQEQERQKRVKASAI